MQMIQDALSAEELDKFRELSREPKAEEEAIRRAADAMRRKFDELEKAIVGDGGGAI